MDSPFSKGLMRCICGITFFVLASVLFVSSARAVDPAVLAEQNRRVAVVDKVSGAVAAIYGLGGGGGGSGVIISADGYALSNFHVTSSVGDFMKCGLSDGRLYDAVIVGHDPTGDVALLKLLGRDNFPFVELGDSDVLRAGDWVFVMGNPFLLATEFQPTVTYGIVSGVHRYQYPAGTFLEYTDCIQVDASINPGNSGGPLFTNDGKLVGINGRGSFEKRGRVNVGAGYAISINQIKHFMDHLKSGRVVDHATLGATLTTNDNGAVIVEGILEQSDAFRRGLRVDDEITMFAGRRIRSVNQFKNILGIYPKGGKLPLVFQREGESHKAYVRLRALHRQSEMTMKRPAQRRRQPRDGKRPRDGKKSPKKGRGGKKPKPILPHIHAAKSKPPAKYKHMLVKKTGFANYYFNNLHQKRLLKRLRSLGDFSKVSGQWRLFGKADLPGKAGAGVDFNFLLDKRAVGLEVGNTPYLQQFDQPLIDEPRGTGGLLVAMHHFKLLLTEGADVFSEFYYLGSETLDGKGPQVDVLISYLGGVQSRWYFEKSGGRFAGFDTQLTDSVDACEIRIDEWADFKGRKLPRRFRVSSGTQPFATFHLKRVQLSVSPGPNASIDNGKENSITTGES